MKNTVLAKSSARYMLIILMALMTISAMADTHSAYLHALTDLRAARWLIANRPGGWALTDNEAAAIHAIEVAVYEIIKADIDDGKYYNDVPDLPNIDIPDRQGRIQRAIELIRKARTDVNLDDDDTFAGGLKVRALAHIDEALRLTEKALPGK
jgi:tetratricopeptide (TPR) repeat protein